MSKMIFVNLPVANVERSATFYEAVGWVRDPRFSDESAIMLSFSEAIHVMLLTHDRAATFTKRRIADARSEVIVGLGLSSESRGAVDATIASAVAAGGQADPDPVQDHGFMYGRSFADPDGHVWDMNWMDVDAALAAGQAAPESQPA